MPGVGLAKGLEELSATSAVHSSGRVTATCQTTLQEVRAKTPKAANGFVFIAFSKIRQLARLRAQEQLQRSGQRGLCMCMQQEQQGLEPASHTEQPRTLCSAVAVGMVHIVPAQQHQASLTAAVMATDVVPQHMCR